MPDNTQTVRDIYDAFGRGDAGAVLAALDPSVRWMEAEGYLYADRNPYIGPQAVAEGVFGRILNDVADFRVTPRAFIAGDDAVAVEGRYTGRVKSTGIALDAQFVHVWRLRDGKVVQFQQYTDTQQWTAAFSAPARV